MFHVPEQFRMTTGKMGSDITYGNNGVFILPVRPMSGIKWTRDYCCIASDGEGWEHVSVHIQMLGKQFTPSWDEMCIIKDEFWDPEDCVIQFHPSEEDYVNMHPHTLHLWRPTNIEFPRPDPLLVGIK